MLDNLCDKCTGLTWNVNVIFMGGVLKVCAGYRGKCLEGKFNHGAFCDLRNLNDGRHPTTQRDREQPVQSPPENAAAREATLT